MTNVELRQLPVDLAELCIALEAKASEFRWFLDVETGLVLLVTDEFDPGEHDGLTAHEIESNPARFRRVPAGSRHEELGDMQAFASQHPDLKLKESLELALEATRPDRRFRAVLDWVPAEREAWRTYRRARAEHRARTWLESLGYTPH